jgi:cobalt-zinc-cadmium efflux system protein
VSGVGEVNGLPVLVVSGVAAVVMAAGALLLGGGLGDDDSEDLNRRAILLDTVADSAAAAGVAISGAVIYATGGIYWLDPAVALVIAVAVGYQAARLLGRVRSSLRAQR